MHDVIENDNWYLLGITIKHGQSIHKVPPMHALAQLSPSPFATYVLAEAMPQDASSLAQLHREVRVATDYEYLPDYTEAAVAEGYFDRFWVGYFKPDRSEDTVIKAVYAGDAVAFVRFGVIIPPPEIAAHATQKWGELHQIYIRPEHQNRGLGNKLFRAAARGLAEWGCTDMLVNVLRDNANARGFYRHQGGRHVTSIVEKNVRNGIVFDIPCALYAFDLT